MAAKGIRGNSFRFIGEEDEDDEADDEAEALSFPILRAATAPVAGDDVSGPALSFFLCFLVEGIVAVLLCCNGLLKTTQMSRPTVLRQQSQPAVEKVEHSSENIFLIFKSFYL